MQTHSDDGIGLLGESTYEILSDSIILTEDEDDASSVRSFDRYSIEDVTSFDDSDSLHDYASDSQEHQGIPRYGGLDELHIDDSDITVKGVGEAPLQIEFEEPLHKSGQVSVVKTLVEFSEQETAQILQHLRPEAFTGNLVCTVRQTMTQELLFLDEPFRLLYVGAPNARDEIQTKIGGALAIPAMECGSSTMSTDSKSSRFNVVPVTSFGTKNSPEVELIESFGVELTTDAVTHTKSPKVEGKHDSVSLCLNGNQWVHSAHGDCGMVLEASGWRLPHLAIIFCSEDDSLETKQTRAATRIFLGRHSVATLIITNKPHYHKPTENFALNIKGIHMCLESKGAHSGDTIYKRLPVDLATFTNLDVRQMNRNLASLTGLSKLPATDSTVTSKPKVSSTDFSMEDLEKRPFAYSYDNLTQSLYWVRERKLRDLWVALALGCLLVTAITGSTLSIAYMKLSRIPNANPMPHVPDRVPSLVPAATAVPSTSASPSTSRSAAKSVPPSSSKPPASCATSIDFTSLLLEPTALAVNDSQKFKIHIIGDNNIILRPPQKYVSLRKPPQLSIEVSRNGKVIETKLSKLFDGVYTIVIPRDDAWGLMNVSVTTNGRPSIQELFEVDFGTPWFKFVGWKKLVTTPNVDLVKTAAQISSDARRKMSDLHQVALQKSVAVQGVINDKLSELSVEAKHLSEKFSSKAEKLYQGAFPAKLPWPTDFSTAGYVRRAQRQAVSLWARIGYRKTQD